jgi:hypothetical protein
VQQKGFNKIAVLGLGKVGHLAAELLQDSGFEVTGIDNRAIDAPFATQVADLTNIGGLSDLLKNQHAVLSCLPYHLNKAVSSAAHELGLHYFDLTEDVPTTKHIRQLADTSKGIMAPQCGLAPGFVGIVAADLANQFHKVRSIRLRVGALPQNPTGLLGYAFNWSPEGVVNEYLNDCEVIEEGVLKSVSAYNMFRQQYKVISPTHIVEFLILDKSFPRSVVHCLQEAELSLYAISGTSFEHGYSNAAEKKISKLLSEIEFTEIDDILKTGLHQFLDDFQSKNNEIGQTVFNTYFDIKPVS